MYKINITLFSFFYSKKVYHYLIMPTYLYTFIVLEYPRLFIEMRNNSLKELHVGMKAEGVLKAIYTEGHYDSIGLRIETECDCVDVDSLFCSGGSDIKSARNEPFKTVLNSKVSKIISFI